MWFQLRPSVAPNQSDNIPTSVIMCVSASFKSFPVCVEVRLCVEPSELGPRVTAAPTGLEIASVSATAIRLETSASHLGEWIQRAACAPRSRDDMTQADMPTMAPIRTRMNETAREMYMQPRCRIDGLTVPRILRSGSATSIGSAM